MTTTYSPGAMKAALMGATVLTIGTAAALLPTPDARADSAQLTAKGFQAVCTQEGAQAAAAGLSATITVKPIKFAMLRTSTRYVAATAQRPAFCQVGGSFVTNPKTGKTANFLATFPEKWNGKYLQLGCSGHCGQFFVSDPSLPPITVTAQGYPNQIIEKGYASIATDEGHEGMESAAWAVRKDGSVDKDFIDDFLWRADKVLAKLGKEYTASFYAHASGAPQKIAKSYFNGCSGGGRDAMVAASYFPEEFDGIIAGSPYSTVGMTFQASAVGYAQKRSPDAALTPALLSLFDKTVKAQCDGLDGVKDGLIQNPNACNFRPERDLPKCSAGAPAGQCFSDAQVETAAVFVNGITDEKGNLVQPGYSVSELGVVPFAMQMLSDPTLKVMVHGNDPAFDPASIFTFRRGGPGPISDFHAVVPSAEVARAKAALGSGTGHFPENTGRLMAARTKLLMWHNFSDEKLTPNSSINWYKQLAARHGGYAKVQQKARLFMLPGTTHCSITGIAPNSFDAIGALEAWVEKGKAPDGLIASVAARDYQPGAPKSPNLSTPNYTMPLCRFPAMARYSGKGDVQDAKNWTCSPKDTRLLTIGESGRQGGVLK